MQIERNIGMGEHATVYNVGNNIFSKRFKSIEPFQCEISIYDKISKIQQIRSLIPQILRTDMKKKVFFATPIGTSLESIRENNDLISNIAIKLVKVLRYLHFALIFHRDIRPENILIVKHMNEYSPLLIDWSFAEQYPIECYYFGPLRFTSERLLNSIASNERTIFSASDELEALVLTIIDISQSEQSSILNVQHTINDLLDWRKKLPARFDRLLHLARNTDYDQLSSIDIWLEAMNAHEG